MAKGLGKKRRERAAKAKKAEEEARNAEEAKKVEPQIRTYRGFTFIFNGTTAIPTHKQCFGHSSYEDTIDCDLSSQKCSKQEKICLEATSYFKRVDNI
jgi:hypothetical protein